MLSSVRLLTVAIVAATIGLGTAFSASAAFSTNAANYGNRQQNVPNGGDGPSNYSVQCYPTAVAYVVKCNKPPVAVKDCYCEETRVKATSGGFLKQIRCRSFKTADLIHVKAAVNDCGTLTRLPKAM